jgi:Protein of unknown function (DUF3617)
MKMHKSSRRLIMSFVTAAAVVTAYPAAAVEIEPGQWQSEEVHTFNGKTSKPETITDCVSATEARDPVKALAQMKGDTGGQCQAVDIKQSGSAVSFVMRCGGDKMGGMNMSATFTFADTRHYSGVIKTEISVMGHKTTSTMTVDAKWLGACKQ